MERTTLLVAGALLAFVWLAWQIRRISRALHELGSAGSAGPLTLLQREIQSVRSGLDDWLRDHMHQSRELSRRLGELRTATGNVERLGVELSELHAALRPPQVRGALGERMLEELLADVLPQGAFDLQHTYPRSGVRVDAAVRLPNGQFLPIDSKFPLDNYRRYLRRRREGGSDADVLRRAFVRDVRRHIDDVARRYLAPEAGSIDLAFCYIPSEAVFQEILRGEVDANGQSLVEYAHRRRVVPVSPNTLHAYLSVVRLGLRGYRLQENSRELLAELARLQDEVSTIREHLATAATQARHSLGHLEDAERDLRSLEDRLIRTNRGFVV